MTRRAFHDPAQKGLNWDLSALWLIAPTRDGANETRLSVEVIDRDTGAHRHHLEAGLHLPTDPVMCRGGGLRMEPTPTVLVWGYQTRALFISVLT